LGTDKTHAPPSGGRAKGIDVKTQQQAGSPGWASGLRQLYESVVDEPLPDTFKDLLAKLDDKS
jgi:hypothetical protein